MSGVRREADDNCNFLELLTQPLRPETSVTNDHYSLRNSPEQFSSQVLPGF